MTGFNRFHIRPVGGIKFNSPIIEMYFRNLCPHQGTMAKDKSNGVGHVSRFDAGADDFGQKGLEDEIIFSTDQENSLSRLFPP